MRRALIYLNLYGCEAVQGQKQPKNTNIAFFACFCPYVRQPHSHIGWDKSMPFASVNPSNPRTNPWNFHKNFLRIGDFEKQFLKKNLTLKISNSLHRTWRSKTLSGLVGQKLNFILFFPVTQECTPNEMIFTIRTNEGFNGRIYTFKHFDRSPCFVRGNGGKNHRSVSRLHKQV